MPEGPTEGRRAAKRAIAPPAFREAAARSRMSPAIVSGDHVFLTGITGGDARGAIPDDPERQFDAVFEAELVLAEAGLTLDAVVEMTTDHVGLRDHFDLFDAARLRHLREPFPAWTAVEVGGLRREGALVEMRAIAGRAGDGTG